MNDTERINWLEDYINKEGGILLHDGSKSNFEFSGLGLRPGNLTRTLREAIDDAGGDAGGKSMKTKAKEFLQGKCLIGEMPAVALLVDFAAWLESGDSL